MRFTTDRAFVVLIGIVFALCLVGVGALRRGPFGRRLVAMSDSQAACATVGLNLARTKLTAFVISGALAGLAGALYGGMSHTVAPAQFQFVNSLVLFVAIVLSGATILTGAVQAGIGLAIVPLIGTHLPNIAGFTYLLFGFGIFAIGRNPYGIGLLYSELGARWEKRRAGTPPAPSGITGGPPSDSGAGPLPAQVPSVG
jgi:branched-chain amino acid transport system permease protein